MAIKLGTTTIGGMRLGSTEITKAYLGSTEIYTSITDGILDLYSAPAAAYSLRSLSASPSSFTSSGDTGGDTSGAWVVQVRRSSDDNLKSFTASELSDGTLTTWTGANDAFISIWYDQSSNANHTTDGGDSSEPKIVDASTGLIVDAGGKPAAEFDGADDYLDLSTAFSTTTGTLFTVANLSTADSSQTILGGGNVLLPYSSKNSTSSVLWSGSFNLSVSGVYVDGAPQSWANRGDAYTATVTDSQVLMALEGVDTDGYNIERLGAGQTGASVKANGTISEIIIYSTDQSSNRASIESDINSYYGIY